MAGGGGGALPCPPAHQPGRAALLPIKCFSVQKKKVIIITETQQILIFFFFFCTKTFFSPFFSFSL